MYKCDQVDCNKEFIGESVRTLGESLKKTSQGPFPHL